MNLETKVIELRVKAADIQAAPNWDDPERLVEFEFLKPPRERLCVEGIEFAEVLHHPDVYVHVWVKCVTVKRGDVVGGHSLYVTAFKDDEFFPDFGAKALCASGAWLFYAFTGHPGLRRKRERQGA